MQINKQHSLSINNLSSYKHCVLLSEPVFLWLTQRFMQCLNLSVLPLMHLKCTAKAHLYKAACMSVYELGTSVVSTTENRKRWKSSKALTFDTVMGEVDKRAAEEGEKERESRMLKKETYSDPLIFVIDFYIVSFPGDGGLRVAARWNTLHYGRLSCSYNHIARGLPEIIPQNCTTEGGTRIKRVKFKFGSWLIGMND